MVVAGDLVDGRLPPRPVGIDRPARRGGLAALPVANRPVDRYSFVGTPDPHLGRRYIGRSVAAHLGTGTQSPVTYVWCGPHWVNTAH